MWPFRKKSRADDAMALMPDAIEAARVKWLYFSKTLVFKDDVSLAHRIASFMVPFEKGLFDNYPVFAEANTKACG